MAEAVLDPIPSTGVCETESCSNTNTLLVHSWSCTRPHSKAAAAEIHHYPGCMTAEERGCESALPRELPRSHGTLRENAERTEDFKSHLILKQHAEGDLSSYPGRAALSLHSAMWQLWYRGVDHEVCWHQRILIVMSLNYWCLSF